MNKNIYIIRWMTYAASSDIVVSCREMVPTPVLVNNLSRCIVVGDTDVIKCYNMEQTVLCFINILRNAI